MSVSKSHNLCRSLDHLTHSCVRPSATRTMSFFDSVKKSLGMSKDKQAPVANRVGSTGSTFDQFEFTFVEEKLGIGISKYTGVMPHLDTASNPQEDRSCPVVTNFDAHKYDIQPGDLIVALEGNPISSFDDFTTIVKAIGRPVRIRFLRRNAPVNGSSNTTARTGATEKSGNSNASSGSNSMGSMNIFRNLSVGGSAKPAPAPVVLSEEEKALRRERLSAAAQDRSKSWDKKLGQKKNSQSQQTPIVDPSAAETPGETHADTERAIRKTKELEVRIEQQMGYSPFRPHMSFASGAAGSAPSSSSTASGAPAVGGGGSAHPLSAVPEGGEPGCGDGEWEGAEEVWVAEVDDAFAMLLSLGESEQEVGRVAVLTVSKMIQNLAASPEDQKLRSIRVSNKAFQSKVAAVPGGAELLVAAGYEYQTCAAAGTGGAGGAEVEELFLVHSMLPDGRGKLRYTLSRIQELLVSVSGATSPGGSSCPKANC